ncbi:glucose-1-phosphate adenylyltransferase [Paenibacillus sp. FSL M7-0802]|jgi:glucose-1-phosphate adenylyltransferase|uniref:glucose-1-phosphate adenylyltransferase n=1 Tax=Paenibacillus TaxID=44249 RepID=UPI00083D6BED|nr:MULTISPECIES: glucose-1-phosphate adenylyltransferase [Paenibacillus]APQ59718.1 glucose-1-phosphate adenylyltransferase [Paenibacillus polymyxa]MCP3743003.1 glucose-1-phosphate adenylyltransferase [Paenibacillus sp. A3M_27_13]ODB59860.1 glucose-1-phosphate adenylyltransferase [Paenibacillus polymyxa]OMF68913.1 glucose-1-phosphate adenylyltransferase [Paenibacillus peoriae]VUG07244.1 Glucose-1-phosphate adenylyltransferase [Paenibacillus polymyxa]
MFNKECIAMLLAGGEGRRLAPLTSTIAKPAVPFGGHYRIIDFPLSNCVNSDIDTVGVLTQYEAESLHEHIGDGTPWGLTKTDDKGITLLPSYNTGNAEYLGTADAIHKNIEYIDSQNPEHVLILSGDHIYYMNYREMLNHHKEKGAAATISVMEVPWDEAHRFGVMSADKDLRVTEFAEKPEKPESNLASMGIYLFKWDYLRNYLLEDAQDAQSSHDFGKDIIPKMLADQESLYVYEFQGYWKDVGTVKSLWDSHMDLLQDDCAIDLQRKDWPMYTRERRTRLSAQKVPNRQTQPLGSLLHDSCQVEGRIERSVVFSGVEVGKGSAIKESIVMPDTRIGRNVHIEHAIIGEGAVIRDGAVIKGNPGEIMVIGPNETVFGKMAVRPQTTRMLKEAYERNTRLRAEGFTS